jgi:hypothetical protein
MPRYAPKPAVFADKIEVGDFGRGCRKTGERLDVRITVR